MHEYGAYDGPQFRSYGYQDLSSAILRALATSGLGYRRFAAADLTGEADDEFTQEEVVLKPSQSSQKQGHHVVALYQRNPPGYREEGSKRDRLGALSVPREPCEHGV